MTREDRFLIYSFFMEQEKKALLELAKRYRCFKARTLRGVLLPQQVWAVRVQSRK